MYMVGRKMDVPLCFRELLCIIFSERVFHETFEKMSGDS